MSDIGQLKPPVRVLLGPGPSEVHPRVLAAMALPVLGHLDPAYLPIMNHVQALLRPLYQTSNPLTFAVQGTGMAGMECCVVNLVEPGDKVVVCINGFFGGRIADIAQRAGGVVTTLECPWGQAFDLD